MDINRVLPRSLSATPAPASGSIPSRAASTHAPSPGLLGGLLHLGRRLSGQSAASAARSAIRHGDVEKLRALIQESPQLILEMDSHQDNLLGVAARGGHSEALEALLDHAAFFPGGLATVVNHRNAEGDTPLTLAAAAGHIDAVGALLSIPSMDVNLADDKGRTALHKAVSCASAPIIGALLIHRSIDPNIADAKGDTPLHTAVAGDNGLAIEMILESAAISIGQLNDRSKSPLLLAVKTGKLEAARQLLKDTRVDVRVADDPQGNSLLHRMVVDPMSKPEWITLLASHPALANRPDRRGRTALNLAIANDQHTALRALLKSDIVETERFDSRLRIPLQQALDRVATAPAAHHVERRIKTLSLLVNCSSVDPNITFANRHTLLTQLCAMNPADRDTRALIHHRAHEILATLLKRGDGRLDVNKPNARGVTPLRRAVDTTNSKLILALMDDPRTDTNVLSSWLTRFPQRAYNLLQRIPAKRTPSQHELELYVERTLARWADKTDPKGKHHSMAHFSNAALGTRLAARESANAAAGRPPPQDCTKGALFRLSVAVEQCVDAQDYRNLAERSRALLAHAPAQTREFNLQGVDISRTEIESWAAGKLPEGGVNRLIDVRVAQAGLANVHNVGLTARGHLIMLAINQRLGSARRLSEQQCINAVRAAIHAAPDATPEWRSQAEAGLDKALAHTNRVGDGLNVTVREALSLMWNHIESYSTPASAEESVQDRVEREALHSSLIQSLQANMVDMSAGYCDTGCVQRILYAADGVDLSLLPREPTGDVVRDEVGTIAGAVNNRFELLYGHGAEDMNGAMEAASNATATPLNATERKVVARYQRRRPIDDGIVVQVKQELLEAAVRADLIERRGWSEAIVVPELERMKELMKEV